jgi:transposase
MPQNFIDCDREQALLMPPNLSEWLAEDHLAYFLIDAVEVLDLEAFYASYRSDGTGAAAHDPAMMLTLLLYAYCTGTSSSRQIERKLTDDVAYRVIAANTKADHATIARFRARHQEALADLFTQVLGLCAEAGLASVGVVSVDGSKLRASASEVSIRTYGQIAEELLGEAERVDAEEDAIHGPNRGDELPGYMGQRTGGRKKRLAAARKRLEQKRAEEPEEVPGKRAERLEQCRRKAIAEWQEEHFELREWIAFRERNKARGGTPPKAIELPTGPDPEARFNVTDPDAKMMKAGRDYYPAYNAQAVTNSEQVIVAAEVITTTDVGHLEPMVDAAERELEAAGVEENPEVILADAGYWSNEQIDNLRAKGRLPLVSPEQTKARPRKTRQGGAYDFMRRAIDSEAGSELYRQRIGMIEPVFGQIKANRGLNRIRRRGRGAARAEWRLIAATHNLLKLHRHTLAATGG